MNASYITLVIFFMVSYTLNGMARTKSDDDLVHVSLTDQSCVSKAYTAFLNVLRFILAHEQQFNKITSDDKMFMQEIIRRGESKLYEEICFRKPRWLEKDATCRQTECLLLWLTDILRTQHIKDPDFGSDVKEAFKYIVEKNTDVQTVVTKKHVTMHYCFYDETAHIIQVRSCAIPDPYPQSDDPYAFMHALQDAKYTNDYYGPTITEIRLCLESSRQDPKNSKATIMQEEGGRTMILHASCAKPKITHDPASKTTIIHKLLGLIRK